MPRTRSLAWSELKIGVLTIVAIVITAVTIFMLTGDRGFPWQRYSLKTRFESVPGLKRGSPVRVAGLEVGSVTEVLLTGDQVDVTFEVSEDVRDRITTGSVATLGSVSLLGESAVDITASSAGSPIPEWGYVPQGRGTLGRLLSDPAAADKLEASLANIETVTRQLNAGEGSLGKLLKDDAFARSLTAASSNIEAVAGRINAGEGTAGKLISDPALFNRLNSVSERLDQLVTRLNEGEGTAGQLLKDRALYENMNKVTTEISALLAEIRQNPRKYLTLRVSIF